MPNLQGIIETDYLDGFQYANGKLKFFPHEEGYVNCIEFADLDSKFQYVYNYTDHLGNIRVSYGLDPETHEIKVLEENHYYPFGLRHENYNSDINQYGRESNAVVLKAPQPSPIDLSVFEKYKYKYNGKELQDELGLNMYDYGFRNYMPDLGRWGNMDSKTEAYYPISPYQYVLNNPIVNIDVKGQWTVTRHYNMTYNSLSAAGIGKAQANLLAHYASVYADNPGSHINLNNLAHPTNPKFYSPAIDYSGTSNSQVTNYRGKGYNYNIWHSMRSKWEEENNTISAADATKRGMEFGWNKIFESAESGNLNELKAGSKGIKAWGQGVHALQDAYAHKGRSDVGVGHLFNDRYGDTSGAERISGSATTVHNILSGNFSAFEGKSEIKFDAQGMTKSQLSKVMTAISNYLSEEKNNNK